MFICGKELNTIYIYTSIPFTSNIHTSRSCRILLESSGFIRLVYFKIRQVEACTAFVEVIFKGDKLKNASIL